VTVVDYNWTDGFTGLFETVFNESTDSNMTFAFGMSALAVTPERINMAHLMYSFFDENMIIVVDERDLKALDGATFFSSLFGEIASLQVWLAMSAVFCISALLMSMDKSLWEKLESYIPVSRLFHAGSLLWNSVFRLFARSIGQGTYAYCLSVPH
jgi:hypothetical protein